MPKTVSSLREVIAAYGFQFVMSAWIVNLVFKFIAIVAAVFLVVGLLMQNTGFTKWMASIGLISWIASQIIPVVIFLTDSYFRPLYLSVNGMTCTFIGGSCSEEALPTRYLIESYFGRLGLTALFIAVFFLVRTVTKRPVIQAEPPVIADPQ